MSIDTNLLAAFWQAAAGDAEKLARVSFKGEGELPSVFAVTSFASATVGACGLALASLLDVMNGPDTDPAKVVVDRRLTSFWFKDSIRPQGWQVPVFGDPITGDYASADGWIRLHTNAPHHLKAALSVLRCENTREAVAAAVRGWQSDELEAAIVASKGCAATMRSWEAWQQHPQGQAVLAEPLIDTMRGDELNTREWGQDRTRPLAGLKVLDLTRVLAGPTCTRMLSAFGADVLRIDPPWWVEPGAEPEMTVGKRCRRVDLRAADQLDLFKTLIRDADVMVHGYRSDALASLGLDAATRQAIKPGLVDVCLDAYGHTGPWRHRRGFDSLVQMSMGIADRGQRLQHASTPKPLPVQALDFGTGYLLATTVLRGLEVRLTQGVGTIARLSLARTGAEVMKVQHPADHVCVPLRAESIEDLDPRIEKTFWGPAQRLRPPLAVTGVDQYWTIPAGPLGSDLASLW